MTLRSALAAALLAAATLAAFAPPGAAHICITETWDWEDPTDCNAHDCGNLWDEGAFHAGHVVYHKGDGCGIHGCGILLHVGVDGQGQDPYACIDYPCTSASSSRTPTRRCRESALPTTEPRRHGERRGGTEAERKVSVKSPCPPCLRGSEADANPSNT